MIGLKHKMDGWFKRAIDKRSDLDSTFKVAIKDHERVKLFLDNFYKQMVDVQQLRIREGKPYFGEQIIKNIFDEFVDTFINAAKAEADKRSASILEKQRIEKIKQDFADMDATAEGKPQGIFEELGVQVGETKEYTSN